VRVIRGLTPSPPQTSARLPGGLPALRFRRLPVRRGAWRGSAAARQFLCRWSDRAFTPRESHRDKPGQSQRRRVLADPMVEP